MSEDSSTIKLISSYGCNLSKAVSGKNYSKTFGSKKEFAVSSGEKLSNFLTNYCNLANADINKEKLTHSNFNKLGLDIGEVVNEDFCPLILEMTFSMKTELNDTNSIYQQIQFYNENFLVNVIKIIQQTISDKLSVSSSMFESICCVLENKSYFRGDNLCRNLKFQFPYCQVDLRYQKQYLFPAIILGLKREKIIADLENVIEDNWNKIIQPIRSVVPLYRSKNDMYESPLSLSHIYGNLIDRYSDSETESCDESCSDVNSIDIEDYNIEEEELGDVFNMSSFSLIKNKNIDIEITKELSYYLPFFLSIHYCANITLPKDEVNYDEEHFEDYDSDKDSRYLAPIFLKMIARFRFEQENYWYIIGNILFNTYVDENIYFTGQDMNNVEDKGLELWTKYSKNTKMSLRSQKACESKYYTFRKTKYTVKTLAFWARIDNPREYLEWHNKWCQDALKDALSLSESKLMEAVYRVFWLDYISLGESYKQGWYYFSKNGFKDSRNSILLRTDINDRLIPIYEKLRDQMRNSSERSSRKRLADFQGIGSEAAAKKIEEIIKKLSKDSNVKSLINMCELRFYNEDFERSKDKNHLLVGCLNGIIECNDKKAYFREALPEDYVTLNTNIRFPLELNWKSSIVVELMEWLGKVFPDKELLDHFLKDESSHLVGKNYEKRLRFWVGNGNAGKSLIEKLHQKAFGKKYCISGKSEMLVKTGKSFGSSGPNPELAQFESAHTAFYNEIGPNDTIDCGKGKKRSGGDNDFARGCGSNGGAIESTVKDVVVLNKVPPVDEMDEAFIQRLDGIMLFLSKFVDDPPESIQEQYKRKLFKKDDFFDQRIEDFAPAFLWVLVQKYEDYKREGIKPPKVIKDYISNYVNSLDHYSIFIRTKIRHSYIREPDPDIEDDEGEIDINAKMTTDEVYTHFKKWFMNNNPGKSIPILGTFENEMLMKDRLGPQHKDGYWRCIKILSKVVKQEEF